MAEDGMVEGAGWISDESSFYGDGDTKDWFEKQTGRELSISHWVSSAKKRKLTTPKINRSEALTASGHRQHGFPDSSALKSECDVSSFLKSRPQISKMQEGFNTDRKPGTANARALTGEEASEVVSVDHFKGNAAAWQHDEAINEFLRRLRVDDYSTARVGPWLWVSSLETSRARQERRRQGDPYAFIEIGVELLQAFTRERSRVEAENPGKQAATITRKLGPYRDKLEEDLLSEAVKTSTTCGKWMLFPGSQDLPRFWRIVAEATSQGKLGPVSKVATPDPYDGKDETLICVYTYDFTDMEDVRRVLDELLGLELCRQDGKPIYYKCDAYTYLNLSSNNEYKLRASLYSSAELWTDEAKASKEGPVARLKKRDQKLDSFLKT